MSLGSIARRAFGPAEPAVARIYRDVFFDGASFGRLLRAWIDLPSPETILEVGCGEGQMMEILAEAFPGARLLGVDIHPAVGRLFRGDRSRVEFRRSRLEGVEE